MHATLETPADGRVELPGNVGRAEDEHTLAIFAYAVHLDEHFRFYPARGFGFAFPAGPAERVDLVDEDDGRLVLAGHGEELADEPGGG